MGTTHAVTQEHLQIMSSLSQGTSGAVGRGPLAMGPNRISTKVEKNC